jgi:glycosyltransferase involved in cell wall biosynthesis
MTSDLPFISICIPAYKRLHYLRRLLASIESQQYKNYEVIITDDSGDDDQIKTYIDSSNFSFLLNYIKNSEPFGTPKNWLESFKYARGEWIKIMHDDDWFSDSNSLSAFVEKISPNVDCIFSGYNAVDDHSIEKNKTITNSRFDNLTKDPLCLFSSNIIGPPSVMMFRSKIKEQFDDRLKWIVDWEYYIRLAKKYDLAYIPRPLIMVSNNSTQVTNSCFLNPAIEIPETLIFTNKYGNKLFEHFFSYDAWWRLIRNLDIRKFTEFYKHSENEDINNNIKRIIWFQSYLPLSFLKVGFISKICMSISYFLNRDR